MAQTILQGHFGFHFFSKRSSATTMARMGVMPDRRHKRHGRRMFRLSAHIGHWWLIAKKMQDIVHYKHLVRDHFLWREEAWRRISNHCGLHLLPWGPEHLACAELVNKIVTSKCHQRKWLKWRTPIGRASKAEFIMLKLRRKQHDRFIQRVNQFFDEVIYMDELMDRMNI